MQRIICVMTLILIMVATAANARVVNQVTAVKLVRVASIESGNTFWATDENGTRSKYFVRFVNVPPTWQPGGYEAKAMLAQLLPVGSTVIVTIHKSVHYKTEGYSVIVYPKTGKQPSINRKLLMMQQPRAEQDILQCDELQCHIN